MTPDAFRAQIANLSTWSKRGERAPHKPLLLLYAFARFTDGIIPIPYNVAEGPLLRLIEDFGPYRKKYQAFAFQRLATSRLWEVEGDEDIRVTASGDWFLGDARRERPVGHLSEEVVRLLEDQPRLLAEATHALLDAHFAPSLHEDILTAIGLDPESATSGRKRPQRDPAFRDAVLGAYGYRCAVCGFYANVGRTLVGIEAAHVMWHSAGGPDAVPNGLALCSVHHKLLDAGAYALRPMPNAAPILEVSEFANGGEGFETWLGAYHGRPLAEPVRAEYRVAEPATTWHRREVFKGQARTCLPSAPRQADPGPTAAAPGAASTPAPAR